jgi:hypothetical protein
MFLFHCIKSSTKKFDIFRTKPQKDNQLTGCPFAVFCVKNKGFENPYYHGS